MAVDFNQTLSQKISYAVDPDFDGLTALTISAWVNQDADIDAVCVGKWNYGGSDKSFLLQYSTASNGWLAEWDYGGGTDTVIISESAPQNAGWVHLASTWATTTRNLYVDGTAGTANTNSRISIRDSNEPLYIGGRTDASKRWAGALEHIALWNVALTQAEISALAAGVNPMRIRPANLLIYVPLYSTDFINDISGAGYAGTFSGNGSLANIDGVGVQPLAFTDLFMPYESVVVGGFSIPIAMHSYRQRRI